jgi:hypothetical protein
MKKIEGYFLKFKVRSAMLRIIDARLSKSTNFINFKTQ